MQSRNEITIEYLILKISKAVAFFLYMYIRVPYGTYSGEVHTCIKINYCWNNGVNY